MLGRLDLVGRAMAQTTTNDYKALVCVYLGGGNDSNNTLVPTAGVHRDQYEAGRGFLALPVESLHPILPINAAPALGVHGSAPELAELFDAGHLAFVSNVGTLVHPYNNRDEYLNRLVPAPPKLFSHSDQSDQWEAGQSGPAFSSGWGGRAAELVDASFNPLSEVSMSISTAGINKFEMGPPGAGVNQYSISASNVSSLNGFGSNYSSALNEDGTYRNTTAGWRLKGLEDMARLSGGHVMRKELGDVFLDSRETEGSVRAALDAAAAEEAAGGFTIDGVFNSFGATSSLGQQLEQVARLIAGRSALGNDRQIFFCRVGGYDTHASQLGAHANLMMQLSQAFRAFHEATTLLGIADSVTTFTASDFNRTFTPNGTDATAGSDHAWGGHALVMGGSVNGANIYGEYPELVVGANLDAGNTRGRWIPTTSVDQYGVVLANWFGVTGGDLDVVFPHRGRFDDPLTVASTNLAFL